MFALLSGTKRIAGFAFLFGIVVLLGAAFSLSNPVNAQTIPSLGAAASFAVLGGQSVTNTGSSVIINGDVGVSPGTAITGFPPGTIANGTMHSNDGVDPIAPQAQTDLVTAYNSLTSQAAQCVDMTGQNLGGLTLTPGVYCFSSSADLTGTLVLNGLGSSSSVFIFLIGSTLTTASNSSVVVENGGTGCNVWWQVGSSATLGTTTAFQGNIIALSSITLTTGANMLPGRALARNGAVTMDTNNINPTACAAAAISTPTNTLVPTATDTPIPTATLTNTLVPTATDTPIPTATLTNTLIPTNTPTVTGTLSATPTGTLSSTPTNTPTNAPTNTPTAVLTSVIPIATTVPGLTITAVPMGASAASAANAQNSASAQSAVSGLPNTGGGAPQATYWMHDQSP